MVVVVVVLVGWRGGRGGWGVRGATVCCFHYDTLSGVGGFIGLRALL